MSNSNSVFKNWLDSSYLTQSNQLYIDQIYRSFLKDPHSVDISWHVVFNALLLKAHNVSEKSDINLDINQYSTDSQSSVDLCNSFETMETGINIGIVLKIFQLINSFRLYGYQNAELDPLNLHLGSLKNELLELKHYNFTNHDLQKTIDTVYFGINKGFVELKNIYHLFKKMYCGSIGIEYMHIPDVTKMLWIRNNFESTIIKPNKFNNIEKKQFLKDIIAAEGLEHYLGIRFPGIKRFSLEGCDVLIPMLKEIVRYSVFNHNIREIFIGMAHRGRLNVLVNVLGKNVQNLFDEFCNTNRTFIGSGDVKYHQGLYSSIAIDQSDCVVNLSLLFNPSHLEIVTPVVMGMARAKTDQIFRQQKAIQNDKNLTDVTILPIVIHGDAAISAQGVVQESFNMSNTYAYDVQGTIHIVVNNQIGFTTSGVYQMRSTSYCTDIAKMVHAPIFHVNADDVDAVIFTIRLALDFRKQFKDDVIIDLVCYRRHGHNEADEPSVTQPIMYRKIKTHATVSTIYSNLLEKLGIINSDEIQFMKHSYRIKLEQKEHCLSKDWTLIQSNTVKYMDKLNPDAYKSNHRSMHNQYLKELAYNINNLPEHIIMHDRIKKIYNDRLDMALGKRLFDWGAAEVLAYATLLDNGCSIRLSGEDVARGTFFHRHVIIHDQHNGSTYIPLMHISKKQGSFFVWDSVLSEEAALAFEYGYACESIKQNILVIWEAQFGDFANGAQVVIDQFISASEQKWGQLCGLVMLLPHGYEGQGPEHSSCRIERYLQLCAENNIKVCIPSTPSQIFHILRQQAYDNIQKPLILVTPKSLLRHSMVNSSIQDLAHGAFNLIFDEINKKDCVIDKINRVIICTGKIYYDLIQRREQLKLYTIAIIRIEQLYPFPDEEIKTLLQRSYDHVEDFVWCQEEPKNQGAWYYIQRCFYNSTSIALNYIGSLDSAAPAVGYASEHKKQYNVIINDALGLNQ